jgi:dienelactone hydrolase
MMNKIITATIVIVIAIYLSGCPPPPPFVFSGDVVVAEDVPYGLGYVDAGAGTTTLPCDIVRPATAPTGLLPALVMVHGGSFSGGSRQDDDMRRVADNLASAGAVCVLIDYRLDGNDPPLLYPFPKGDISYAAARAAMVDTATAIRYVRANADALGVDQARIAVFGESAGAVAALAVGVSPPGTFADDGLPVPPENNPGVDDSVSAIVDCWGSADYFLDDFDSADPAIMVWHGTNDTTAGTYFLSALSIVQRCEALGIPYVFYPILGAGHGAWDGNYMGTGLSSAIAEFLDLT